MYSLQLEDKIDHKGEDGLRISYDTKSKELKQVLKFKRTRLFYKGAGQTNTIMFFWLYSKK